MTITLDPPTLDLSSIKARQKATWESGDFGQVAKYIEPAAEDFMARLPLRPGDVLLDAACGIGNLAVIAARRGCATSGLDIATNLIAQAHAWAVAEGLDIAFTEGDAEALPYDDEQFDAVVSMFGVMFAPQPEVVAAELHRVTRPGGFVALANWTPEGFIGKMFDVFKAHLPSPPPGLPSPMLWGHAPTVTARLSAFAEVRMQRRLAVLRYPFPPAESVEFFRRYYGPTGRAFDSLESTKQEALRRDLVELQATHNVATTPNVTETHAEYLEVITVRDRE